MKKRFVLISLLFIFLSITLIAPIFAVEKQDTAYQWLNEKQDTVEERTSLSPDDISFLLLAFSSNDSISPALKTSLIGKSSNNGGRWNNFVSTAYAIMALRAVSADTTKAEEWLLSQEKPAAANLNWYLQIDPPNYIETNCTVNYGETTAEIIIKRDKKYQINSGSACFSLESNGYWLRINSGCVGKTFFVSCDPPSLVSLLFKEGDILHIQSTGAKTTDAELRVESSCLDSGSGCDYQGTLWAAYALTLAGNERASELLPYLISPADTAPPKTIQRDALLYLITGTEDYAKSLLGNQSSLGYWPRVGATDYFDTAVAVHALAFGYRDTKNVSLVLKNFNSTWKTDSNWGGVQPTALILYSLFPKRYTTECEKEGQRSREGFKCSEESPGADYIVNSSFSCVSFQGTETVDMGTCYQYSPCRKAGGVCNVSNMRPNYYPLDLGCGSGTCWNESLCYSSQDKRSCKSSCDSRKEVEVFEYNETCGTSYTCCKQTTCALLDGTCKTSGDIDEWERKDLTSSCAAGLKCFARSPCALANMTCVEGSKCPSGFKQKKSARYSCNINAVCCEVVNPPQCTFSCLTECNAPFTPIGNFLCPDETPDCCRIEDTCSVNKGYSCKALCSANEIEATGLNCPEEKGTCCKPHYQCNAANDTCRTGTSCLGGEKIANYSCPESQLCCESVPSNVCQDVYGFNCKPTCAAAETRLSYQCATGVCCTMAPNITCATTYDCSLKPECNNQIVQDPFFRNVKCEYGRELSCNDNLDNDGDGFIDGEDPDCPTCSNSGYSCCSECEAGHSQSSLDLSCSPDVCCDQCKTVTATCQSEGYSCCSECEAGTEISSYDGSCAGNVCCGSCKAGGKTWLYIVLVILVLGIGGAAYYLMQKKKKPRGGALPPGVGFRPPVRPYMPPTQQSQRSYMPSPPSRQPIQLRQQSEKPKPTKTEEELEETLKKLKRMSGK
jgi:hypothetical protein